MYTVLIIQSADHGFIHVDAVHSSEVIDSLVQFNIENPGFVFQMAFEFEDSVFDNIFWDFRLKIAAYSAFHDGSPNYKYDYWAAGKILKGLGGDNITADVMDRFWKRIGYKPSIKDRLGLKMLRMFG